MRCNWCARPVPAETNYCIHCQVTAELLERVPGKSAPSASQHPISVNPSESTERPRAPSVTAPLSINRRSMVSRVLGFVGLLLMYSCYTAAPVGVLVSVAPDYDAALQRYEHNEYLRRQAVDLVNDMPAGTGAVCGDGWFSSSTGAGTCSWHGGVRMWADEVRAKASSAPLSPPKRGFSKEIYLCVLAILWIMGFGFFLRVMRSG